MTVADYVVDYLIKKGITDAFGIPGGVVLKLLYAMEMRKPEIVPHLNYHEQMSGFAACGYAQATGQLGVAYATRGPGITNMYTCIAEAYQESIPVMFITAHSKKNNNKMRFEYNQELNLVENLGNITKYSKCIETIEEVQSSLREAYESAMMGRKGPVFLDFSSSLWGMQWNDEIERKGVCMSKAVDNDESLDSFVEIIQNSLKQTHRPIILIGDGMRDALRDPARWKFLDDLKIPVLSSRGAQDIFVNSSNYFGYIGSHGIRYSNFILSKADLIIVLGNRLAFPVASESFRPIVEQAQIIHIDIDENEFERDIPNSINFCGDAINVLDKLNGLYYDTESWLTVCKKLQNKLVESDVSEPVRKLAKVLETLNERVTFVSDIGNNEFWFSRAYEYVRPRGSLLCSKSFGTLGNALGKAIGAYYGNKEKIICIMGDQGFQYNIQELQFISQWKLPIKVILMNNRSSGMIKDHQEKISNKKYVHVTENDGYSIPEFRKIVEGYGISYFDETYDVKDFLDSEKPSLYEIRFNSDISLEPNLQKGNVCQNLTPKLSKDIYDELEAL